MGTTGEQGGHRDLVPQVDALGDRVRRLPPPSWTGPTADAFGAGLLRTVRMLDAAAGALARAQQAARRLGAP